jgi:ADP-heptose:LPS heptosyltransferase
MARMGFYMARNKNALVTLATGKKHKAILAETIGQMRKYADQHGLDFLACNEDDLDLNYTVPGYAKLEVIGKALNIYKRVCFVDADVLISDKAPNIFDAIPEGSVGMFNEAPWVAERHIKDVENWEQLTGKKLTPGKYYNTGVMVFDNDLDFGCPDFLVNHYGEQSYINQHLVDNNIEVHDLDYKWNRMSCTWIKGIDPRDAHFIHFAGQNYPENQGGLPKFIRERLSEWKQNNFEGHSKILIVTGGGMGNQVATLPVVAEIMHLHAGSIFGIHSAYPEVFEHLASDTVEILKPQMRYADSTCVPESASEIKEYSDELQKAFMYSRVISTHGPSPFDMTQMNSTDYHSLMALGRQLTDTYHEVPKEHYGPKLDSNVICIHAGFNAWKSKDVPRELYQEVLNSLKERGYKIALIGKSDFKEHGQGYGAYKLDNYDYNFMDLPFAQTCKVIFDSAWLITNDSMPAHVVQYTNTKTLLITVAKEPDLIFNRYYDKWYAATGTPQWIVAPRKAFYLPHEKIVTTNEWVEGMAWPTSDEIISAIVSAQGF